MKRNNSQPARPLYSPRSQIMPAKLAKFDSIISQPREISPKNGAFVKKKAILAQPDSTHLFLAHSREFSAKLDALNTEGVEWNEGVG